MSLKSNSSYSKFLSWGKRLAGQTAESVVELKRDRFWWYTFTTVHSHGEAKGVCLRGYPL